MYICPICNKQFKTEEQITKHSLPCWKEHNPNHKSKSAPRNESVKYDISNSVLEFFASF